MLYQKRRDYGFNKVFFPVILVFTAFTYWNYTRKSWYKKGKKLSWEKFKNNKRKENVI